MLAPPSETAASSRDLRTGGRWTPGQWLKNSAILVVVRSALAIADRLPAPLLPHVGRWLGAAVHLACPSLRQRAERQVHRTALGPTTDPSVLVKTCFRRLGENLGLCLLLRRYPYKALSCVEVSEPSRAALRTALSAGRGVVFLTPHLGPYELVAAAIAELGHKPAVVVRESYDPRLDPLVDRHRLDRGMTVVHRGRAHATRRILRLLRAGRPVGFLPDLPGRISRIKVHLLGTTAHLARGPLVIARRSGASIVVGALAPVVSARRGGRRSRARYALNITELGPCSDERIMAQRTADALSEALVRMPEQWLWTGVAFADEQENKPG
jgi:KDO2-lipid IV(A) lauroyltransferase